MKDEIFKILEELGLTSYKSAVLFSKSTRDVEKLNVWKDRISDVIYIKNHYVGDKQYENSEYLEWSPRQKIDAMKDEHNLSRRLNDLKHFFFVFLFCDFGCGSGLILQSINKTSESAVGIEMQKKHQLSLQKLNIKCFNEFQPEHNNFFDVISLFHVLEHLPNPIKTLNEIHSNLKSGGKIIVEVPHAKELLLRDFTFCEEYKKFTLWSQHLILHTRNSLSLFLDRAGFKVNLRYSKISAFKSSKLVS